MTSKDAICEITNVWKGTVADVGVQRGSRYATPSFLCRSVEDVV